ncbi:S8 family serine peptidase [Herpetosiphon geysericola]|uniref:S8 family serine peptidase n=1 Tax=Herpetosiphon geysericola TaxID=70996 RepID=UPI0006C90480|nr:S8 family serine peptidase [Herpetosiphon geysericola]
MKRLWLRTLVVGCILGLAAPTITAGQTRLKEKTPENLAAAEAPAVAGQYLIKFNNSLSKADRKTTLKNLGADQLQHLDSLDLELIEFAALKNNASIEQTERVLAELKNNPAVEYVEPNYIYVPLYTPNDPGIAQQWAWGVIKAYDGWNITQGNSSVIIAIVDTGIQINHPDLDANIVAGYDFVDNDTNATDGNGHGTHLAGTAAAETNNSTGGAGLCPNCRLMPIRVFNNNGSGTLAAVAQGITYAANNGAKVINLGLGGSASTTLKNAVDYAWNKGAFLSCAVGGSNSGTPTYPAGYANCFPVAASGKTDIKTPSSGYGTWVKVAAPGVSIYSTWLNGGYNTISGTSTATAHVAGLAGLLASQNRTNAQIRDRICATANPIAGTGTYWSCGRINVYAAVQ